MGWQEDLIEYYKPIWVEEDLKRKADWDANIAKQKAKAEERERVVLQAFADKISKLTMTEVNISCVSRITPYGKFQAVLDNVRFFEDSFAEKYEYRDMYGEEPDETRYRTVDSLRMEMTCLKCGHIHHSVSNKTITDSSHVAAFIHNVNQFHGKECKGGK